MKRSEHILQLWKGHHFTLVFCWKVRQELIREAGAERIKTIDDLAHQVIMNCVRSALYLLCPPGIFAPGWRSIFFRQRFLHRFIEILCLSIDRERRRKSGHEFARLHSNQLQPGQLMASWQKRVRSGFRPIKTFRGQIALHLAGSLLYSLSVL